MVATFLSFVHPTIYSVDALAGTATLNAPKSAESLGAATATSFSTLSDVVHHVPERMGLVLLGVALLSSAALLRRKWKVVRPS